MAAVTICSDFGAQKNSLILFPLFPDLFPIKWWYTVLKWFLGGALVKLESEQYKLCLLDRGRAILDVIGILMMARELGQERTCQV